VTGDETRDQLAAALWEIVRDGSGFIAPERNADALLPTVRKIAADERAKARAQVASDLADLVTDSGGTPSRAALVDFIYRLEPER
jgi:parvulin-like peptidyl-prolyl isomerase